MPLIHRKRIAAIASPIRMQIARFTLHTLCQWQATSQHPSVRRRQVSPCCDV